MQIISRSEAKAKGLKTYFTGNPCKHGHLSARQVSNSTCTSCQMNRNNARRVLPEVRGKINKQLRDRYKSSSEYRSKVKHRNKEYRSAPHVNDKIIKYRSVQKNKDRANELRREKYRKDPAYRAAHLVRINVKRALKARCANVNINKQGYTPDQLKKRIECQFKDGMNWCNHGEWHIDHKKPVDRFIKQGIFDHNIINALSNLQPMWAAENQSKNNRFN